MESLFNLSDSKVTDEKGVELGETIAAEEPVAEEEPTAEVVEEEGESSTEEPSLQNILPNSRDYTDFDAEEAKLLKQMSNEAYDHFSSQAKEFNAIKKELEEVKTAAPKEVERLSVDHPEGYILSESFRDSLSKQSKAKREHNHWRQQLLKIRNGEEWHNIEGYDAKDNLVLAKDPYKPTQQAELDVETAMQDALGLSRKFSGELQGIQTNHKKEYEQATNELQKGQEERFEWLKNKKYAETEINVPNVGKTNINKIKKDFVGAIPKSLRSHPMADLASNLFVALQLQNAQLAQISNTKKEKQKTEPRSGRTSSEKASGEEVLTVPDDFFFG